MVLFRDPGHCTVDSGQTPDWSRCWSHWDRPGAQAMTPSRLHRIVHGASVETSFTDPHYSLPRGERYLHLGGVCSPVETLT